jgi:uncharacterized protein (TIGR03000 family)
MITAIIVLAILKGGGDSHLFGHRNHSPCQNGYAGQAADQSADASAAAPATIEMNLPAEAKVTIDDTITESTSAIRTFVSPPLEPGAEYNYNIKVEIIRDRRAVIAQKQITVRAGEIAKVAVRLSEDVAQR